MEPRYYLLTAGIWLTDTLIKNRMDRGKPGERVELPAMGRRRQESGRRDAAAKEKGIPASVKHLAGRFSLRLYRNRGAFLNLGESRSSLVKGISVALTAALTGFYCFGVQKGTSAWFKTGLALLVGGALGNTSDRLIRGYVVDYLSVECTHRHKRIIFNLSDVCVLSGCLLLLSGVFRAKTEDIAAR